MFFFWTLLAQKSTKRAFYQSHIDFKGPQINSDHDWIDLDRNIWRNWGNIGHFQHNQAIIGIIRQFVLSEGQNPDF